MKLLSGLGIVCLAAALAAGAAFGQTTPPRAHSAAASGEPAGDTPYLGVSALDMTADRAKALKLKDEIGVEVTSVEPDSAAAKAGLKVGDVILEFSGQKVQGWEQLTRLVRETPVHREVKLSIWRNGAEQTLTATMGSRRAFQLELGNGAMLSRPYWTEPTTPMPTPMPPPVEIPQFRNLMMMGTSSLGIMGEALGQEQQLADYFGVKEGVLVRSVNKDSAAEKAGMKAGDVITKIDDTAISNAQQISGVLRGARNKSTVTVTVVRNKKEMTLTVTPDAAGGYRGGLWGPDYNSLMEVFQPGWAKKIVWQ